MFERVKNETWVLKLPMKPVFTFINDPLSLEFVLKTEFDKFDKGPNFQHLMHDLLGKGIFNADGEEWKIQRKLAAKIFNVKNFKDYVRDVFSGEMRSFAKVLEFHAEDGSEFDLQELFFRFTFDTFARIGFGVEMDSMTTGTVPFMAAFDAAQAHIVNRNLTPCWEFVEKWNGEAKIQRGHINLIREFGSTMVNEKRSLGLGSNQFLAENDLLALLMRATDEEGNAPSDIVLIDYCLNFMLGGRDTTACTLSWATFMLHKHPNVQAKLLQEISTVLNGAAPTYDQIRNHMPYANAILSETLRLYPGVPRNRKEANMDVTLPDGTMVSKGGIVSWSAYAMGRTEAIWGPDAKEFKPERWLAMAKQPSPFDYPVFNAGPRMCLGKSMAELQVVFVLVELNRRFKIEVTNEEHVTYLFSVLMPMKNGLKVKCSTNLILPVVATAAAVTGILAYIYREDPILCQSNTVQKRVHRIGGALPFLGDTLTLTLNIHRIHDFVLGVFEKTRNEPFVGKLPFKPVTINVNDPACVECVLKSEFTVFDKGSNFQEIFHDLLGHGIFNSDGEEWKSQRKLAATIFNVKNFKLFVRDVFSDEMEYFCNVLESHAESDNEFDLQELFFRFTFDSFTKIGFGVEVNTMSATGTIPFMAAFDSIQARMFKRFMTPMWEYAEYWSGEANVHAREIKLIREFGQSIVDQKKRQVDLGGNDLLSLLMRAEGVDGASPTDKVLVDYCLNFLLAGRDTTACALSWAVFMIHSNPHVLEKFLNEIEAVLNNSTPSYDQLHNQLPYANAIFHETLRLYPSVPSNKKQANTDITLPDGTFVPKGCGVSWSPYVMGRTEAIWGPDAKEFKPERWLKMEKQPSPFDYPVFQAGPRVCLGKSMAELEGVYVLVELFRKFKIEVTNEKEVIYATSVLLPMKNGLKVKCSRRE
ncbi:hypothetical protein HDU98_002542 [Podochytrium sp. JEL0797]|nr:hypothetical protein HDU98_002542 [Podochytrium sp. JEL0797]